MVLDIDKKRTKFEATSWNSRHYYCHIIWFEDYWVEVHINFRFGLCTHSKDG